MSKYTLEQLKDSYTELWNTCTINSDKLNEVNSVVSKINKNIEMYKEISEKTGVPLNVIGVIHYMECGLKICHLHNGDPLSSKTIHVPSGRPTFPPKNGISYTFVESAIDALSMKLPYNHWDPAGCLYFLESYNGFGYHSKGINSPYLWSFSNHYTKGKYVADGHYDPNAVSKQCGAATILKKLQELKVIDINT